MFAELLAVEKINVLLVEDSNSEAQLTQQQLQSIDDEFIVRRVSNLSDAIKEIKFHDIGVVILDLGLPDSSGPQAIGQLIQRFPHLPIVVLSGRQDPETIRRSLEYGAQEFVSKMEASGDAIRQALLSAMIRKSLKK